MHVDCPYYQPASQGGDTDSYWLCPTASNTLGNNTPGTGAANYMDGDYATTQSSSYSTSQDYLTNVWAYPNSASHHGTFDQGGNVWEWNDAVISFSSRGLRGGNRSNDECGLRSSARSCYYAPHSKGNGIGFCLAGIAAAAPPQWHFEYSGGVPAKLVWQTEAGRSYDLFQSSDLTAWTRVGGFPRAGTGAPMEHSFTPATLGFFKPDLQDRIRAAEHRLGEIAAALAGAPEVDAEAVQAALASFDAAWDAMPVADRCRLLSLLLERVTYDGESIALTFRQNGFKKGPNEQATDD